MGLWDTLGGFLEEDEDALDGACTASSSRRPGIEVDVGRLRRDFSGPLRRRADDAPSNLNLVWEASIASGEPRPDDDVSELRWFAPRRAAGRRELAFRWLAACLPAWAASGARCTKGPANRPFG